MCISLGQVNLVPRDLVTLSKGQCPAVERPTRTSGEKRSVMTEFLDFRFYCACVRLHVSTNGRQDSWTSSLMLDKGNEDSGNEIGGKCTARESLQHTAKQRRIDFFWVKWTKRDKRLWQCVLRTVNLLPNYNLSQICPWGKTICLYFDMLHYNGTNTAV